MSEIKRYASVTGARTRRELEAYLPDNFRVISEVETIRGPVFTIEGVDRAGWTLEDYVLPRLASGLIRATLLNMPDGSMCEPSGLVQ